MDPETAKRITTSSSDTSTSSLPPSKTPGLLSHASGTAQTDLHRHNCWGVSFVSETVRVLTSCQCIHPPLSSRPASFLFRRTEYRTAGGRN